MNIAAPSGSALAITGTGVKSQVFERLQFLNTPTIGTITGGGGLLLFFTVAFVLSGGLTLTGTFGQIALLRCSLVPNTGQTAITTNASFSLGTTGAFNITQTTMTAVGTLFDLDNTGTYPLEGMRFINCSFTSSPGVMFAPGGSKLTESSEKILLKDVLGKAATRIVGEFYISGNVSVTTITTAGVYEDFAGTTTAGMIERTTHSTAPNQITLGSTPIRNAVIMCAGTAQHTGGPAAVKTLAFSLYKNSGAGDVFIAGSELRQGTGGDGRTGSLTTFAQILSDSSDIFKVKVANLTDTEDVIVTDVHLIVELTI
jgi:hypothetical protein